MTDSRRKGREAERAVANWLKANGFPHAEPSGRGVAGSDMADIGAGLTIEVKNQSRAELAAWVDQMLAEMRLDGSDVGLVIHKRRGATNVGDWYATMPTAIAIHLLRAAGYGDPLPSEEP